MKEFVFLHINLTVAWNDVQSKQGLLDVLEDQLRNKQAQEIKAREQKRVEFEGQYSNSLMSYLVVIT